MYSNANVWMQTFDCCCIFAHFLCSSQFIVASLVVVPLIVVLLFTCVLYRCFLCFSCVVCQDHKLTCRLEAGFGQEDNSQRLLLALFCCGKALHQAVER